METAPGWFTCSVHDQRREIFDLQFVRRRETLAWPVLGREADQALNVGRDVDGVRQDEGSGPVTGEDASLVVDVDKDPEWADVRFQGVMGRGEGIEEDPGSDERPSQLRMA